MIIMLRELKANLRSLLIWSLAIGALNFFVISVYPSFAKDMARMEDLMQAYPESFKKAFGLDRLSLTDPVGFFATESYFFIVLFGSIFAVILSSSLLAKEEDEKTAEFLLAKPVTRNQVLNGKVLSFVILLLAFNLLIGIITLAGYGLFVDMEYSRSALLNLLVAPVLAHLAFAGLAFLMALLIAGKRSVYSAGIGLVLVLYFFNVLASLAERVEFLRYLSPFYYIDAPEIIHGGGIALVNAIILLGVAAVALGMAYLLYNRRDITL